MPKEKQGKVKSEKNYCSIERLRRQKIQLQFDVLKEIVPTCAARGESEKLHVLQGTVDYIKEMQSALKDLLKTDSSKTLKYSHLLPSDRNAGPVLMNLLPSYKPPEKYAAALNEQMAYHITNNLKYIPNPMETIEQQVNCLPSSPSTIVSENSSKDHLRRSSTPSSLVDAIDANAATGLLSFNASVPEKSKKQKTKQMCLDYLLT
ncbi:hypothetical protein HDV02_001051 [Globomyces sp. JEL0801]|nr:hypothetical protein HDV02_001051 [Globomyces sp. JEL0801]